MQSAVDNLDFDWAQPGALGGDYIRRMLRIQQAEPIFWSDHQQAWIVTRHADILEGLQNRKLSNRRYHLELEANAQDAGSSGSMLETVRRWMFNNDGRDHMRLRTLLMKPFSKRQAEDFRPIFREMMIARMTALTNGHSFNFASEFSHKLVASSLLKMLGFENVLSAEQMISMAETIVAALVTASDADSVRKADHTIDQLTPIIQNEIAARREAPRDDLLSSLIHISEAGDRLSEEDIISIFHVLLLAAIDTTSNSMSLMVAELDKSQKHREYIRQHPERIGAIVEELQRFIDMQNLMHRIVGDDFEWHGKQLKKGQMIYLMLGIGNFDANVYPDPEKLDFERDRGQMLAFAPGLHHCLGFNIARMELEEFLLHTYVNFENVEALESPTYQANPMTRCFEELRVRLIPRN